MPTPVIDKFENKWFFLSNFWESDTARDFYGIRFHSVEAFFQSMKTTDKALRRRIASMKAGPSKGAGRNVKLRPEWEYIKVDIMAIGVLLKFAPGTPEAEMLLSTGDATLIEGNTWGDQFWGVCKGEGENVLGLILESVRHALRSGTYDQMMDAHMKAVVGLVKSK